MVIIPSVSKESFSVIGTPCNGPTGFPFAMNSSRFSACFIASVSVIWTTAFKAPFTLFIWSICVCVISLAEVFLSFKSNVISLIVVPSADRSSILTFLPCLKNTIKGPEPLSLCKFLSF